MSDISEIYAEAVHDNLKPLYANWDVGAPRQLGDYGILEDDIFVHIGNVTSDFNIQFNVRQDKRQDTRSFSSKGSTAVKITAQGQAPAGGAKINAKLEITFSSEDAIFFNAAGCDYSMIESKGRLGSEIMRLYDEDKWDRDWVIITDIVDSNAVTVAISSSDASSITFEADASIPNIDLANPQLKLSIQSSQSVGFQLAAQAGKNLLLGFCQIQGFWGSTFKPVTALALNTRVEVPNSLKAKATKDDLFFGPVQV